MEDRLSRRDLSAGIALAISAGLFGLSCFHDSPTACETNADCFEGEECSGGTCVARAPTDTTRTPEDSGLDGSAGGGDDTGGGGDGLDVPSPDDDVGDTTGDSGRADGEGDVSCFQPPSSDGVCERFDRNDGDCRPPDAFEPVEESCSDGLDNDCDGVDDGSDSDCDGRPGVFCNADSDCIGGPCVQSPRSSRKVCAHQIGLSPNPTSGDMQGAPDEHCTPRAGAGDGRQWSAVVSRGNMSPRVRIEIEAPVYNMDGVRVADGAEEFWGETGSGLQHPVGETLVTGGSVPDNQKNVFVWAGLTYDSSTTSFEAAANCMDWTSGEDSTVGHVGRSAESTTSWLDAQKAKDCSTKRWLYCIDGQ